MDISSIEYKRCTVIKPVGRIDSLTAPELETALRQLTANGVYNIVMDMSQVNFVGSRGLWALIDIYKVCKPKGGEVVLACLDPEIQGSFKNVAMDTYFKIYDDVVTAVGSF